MAVFKLEITVTNITNVLTLYDEMQVWRSEAGESGPYTELTAAAAEAATLLAPNAGSYTLNGLTLLFEVDGGVEQTVTFVSADPISADDVADFVNDNSNGVTAVEEGGALRISSDEVGTDSILEITGGTSLTEFGWVVGDKDTGASARITLAPGQTTYFYDDQSGDASYFYKTRYYNSTSGAYSPFSDPLQGNVGSIVDGALLIIAQVDLANLDGTPIVDRRVSFYNVYVPTGLVVDDIGIVGRKIDVFTDAVGHAETPLIMGSVVNVSISGTSIVRKITVPSVGTEFDVMDAIAAADDVFQIQVPDIPAAVRRS
jgi:hypothetical protein